ncbi:hypothetical protein [Luteolibacter soli]|uniref:Secreted protein n=1 Tax=Luteolibacter soli TaxID=3135280 RepID=A0ABU9AY35_9BACT
MNADIWFSAGVTVASLAAVAVAIHRSTGTRGIPRGRVGVLVKILSAARFQRSGEAREDWGCRLQSFGDVACAFADAMNDRGNAAPSHTEAASRGGSHERRRLERALL